MSHEKKNQIKDTILCLEDSDFWEMVFSDVLKMDNVILMNLDERWKELKSPFLKKLCRIHHSWKLNSKICLPLKNIWNKYDYIYRQNANIKRWIFTDTSVRNYSRSDLKEMKGQGIKIHMLFLNPMISAYETTYANKLADEGFFELIYTVDKDDAEKYGYIYTNAVYSRTDIEVKKGSSWKLSYVGAAKNRLGVLYKLAELFNHTRSIFYIMRVPDKDKNALPNIVYDHNMDYREVLNIVAKSDCILEVVQQGQNGFTFRTYEALCYNKKLLTNNKDITKYDFYDSKFIHVFDEIDKSLIDFVNDDNKPEFNYAGEYSPLNLYKDMIEREVNI